MILQLPNSKYPKKITNDLYKFTPISPISATATTGQTGLPNRSDRW